MRFSGFTAKKNPNARLAKKWNGTVPRCFGFQLTWNEVGLEWERKDGENYFIGDLQTYNPKPNTPSAAEIEAV